MQKESQWSYETTNATVTVNVTTKPIKQRRRHVSASEHPAHEEPRFCFIQTKYWDILSDLDGFHLELREDADRDAIVVMLASARNAPQPTLFAFDDTLPYYDTVLDAVWRFKIEALKLEIIPRWSPL